MGQRSQIVLIAPPVEYGDDNPNSNKGKIYISHNQWRYGINAVFVLVNALKKFKKLKENNQTGMTYFFSSLKQNFDSCLRYAENHDMSYELSQSHPFEDKTEFLVQSAGTDDFMERLQRCTDNNNGWFFVKVDKHGDVKIGILNGLEDSPEIKQRSAEEYVKMFSEPDEEDKVLIDEFNQTLSMDIDEEVTKFIETVKKDYERKESD